MKSSDALDGCRREKSSLCAESLSPCPMTRSIALLLHSDTVSGAGDGPSSNRAAPLAIERL